MISLQWLMIQHGPNKGLCFEVFAIPDAKSGIHVSFRVYYRKRTTMLVHKYKLVFIDEFDLLDDALDLTRDLMDTPYTEMIKSEFTLSNTELDDLLNELD